MDDFYLFFFILKNFFYNYITRISKIILHYLSICPSYIPTFMLIKLKKYHNFKTFKKKAQIYINQVTNYID